MTAPLRFVFGLHLHQPVGNFDHVMADHVRDVYRPIIERATAAGFFPLTLHVSGPLLEWLEDHDTAWLDMIGRLATDGRLELLLAGFDEPISRNWPPISRRPASNTRSSMTVISWPAAFVTTSCTAHTIRNPTASASGCSRSTSGSAT